MLGRKKDAVQPLVILDNKVVMQPKSMTLDFLHVLYLGQDKLFFSY